MEPRWPPSSQAFRAEARAFIDAELPGRDPVEWDRLLHETGWAVPRWPVAYGGRGLGALEAAIWYEECAAAGAPIQPPAGGELLVGPTLLQWGTDEQKERFLPPIARGEEIWCQGFSEPDAGSDLASLRTTARLEGDEWVLDGHKIWTSQAQHAHHMFVLARTDPDAPRHRGISYLLLPMDQPGVEVRDVVQPDGTAGFAEVLLDGARTSAGNLVGRPGDGWAVAMSTLGFERGTSPVSSWQRYLRDWHDVAATAGGDPVLRDRLARAWIDVQLLRYGSYRILTAVLHPEHEASVAPLEAGVKVTWTELAQRLTNLGMDAIGIASTVLTGGGPAPGVGLGHREPVHPYPAGPLQSAFLFARAGTIFGGTSQVQRNIIAERVLGLPR